MECCKDEDYCNIHLSPKLLPIPPGNEHKYIEQKTIRCSARNNIYFIYFCKYSLFFSRFCPFGTANIYINFISTQRFLFIFFVYNFATSLLFILSYSIALVNGSSFFYCTLITTLRQFLIRDSIVNRRKGISVFCVCF